MVTFAARRPGRLILSLIFVAACVAFADPPSAIAQSLAGPACPGGTGTVVSAPQSWLAGAPFVVSIQSNPHVRAELSFFDFSANGTIDHGFGKNGVADVELPYLSQSFPASAVPVTLATNGVVSALVTSTASGKALRLIQLPY